MAFDVTKISRNDQVIAGAGLAVLLFSFFSWYKVESDGSPDFSFSAWDTNIWAKLGVLLCLLAAVWVLLQAAEVRMTLPVGPALVAVVLAGLGTLLILITLLNAPQVEVLGFEVDLSDVEDNEADVSRGIGLILALLAAGAQTAFAAMKFKESGEAIPGVAGGTLGANAAGMPPAGYSAPQPPPPSGDYPPPPPPPPVAE